MGERTSDILLIVLELILTPIFSRHIITHLVNLERGIVGVAMVIRSRAGSRHRSGEEDRVAEVARQRLPVLGGVAGDRGVGRVLDSHRGLADGTRDA